MTKLRASGPSDRIAIAMPPAMLQPERGEITLLLDRIQEGDRQAISDLAALAFPELRRLAASCLRGQPPGQTWVPTDLVNELWVRLLRRETIEYQNRGHFLGAAAHQMRALVIDHARARCRSKRSPSVPGAAATDQLDASLHLRDLDPADLVALDDALNRLAEMSPRQVQVVERRYFAEFTVEETGQILGVSAKTVKRDWAAARAWLHAELRERKR